MDNNKICLIIGPSSPSATQLHDVSLSILPKFIFLLPAFSFFSFSLKVATPDFDFMVTREDISLIEQVWP